MQIPQLQEDLSESRRGRRQVRHRKRGRKTKIVLIAILVAVLLGVAGGYAWLRVLEGKMQLEPREAAEIKKIVASPQGDAINIVLVGTDRRPGWKSSRADSIVFIKAYKENKKAYLLSIPRDTRVVIPDHGMDKINHSWAFGGAPLLINTVSKFLGQPINYFFQVDFVQFEKAVDAMGGVDFATDLSWYDGELGVQVRSGLRHRSGKEALALVRNRHVGPGGGGDLVRVPVQQQFLQAMISQSINSYADVPRTANIVASYVNTNMTLGDMIGSGRAFAGGDLQLETTVLPGKGAMIKGVSYIIPDLKTKEALVSAMLRNEPFPQ